MQMLKKNSALFVEASQSANRKRRSTDDRSVPAFSIAAAVSSEDASDQSHERIVAAVDDSGPEEYVGDADDLIIENSVLSGEEVE